MIAELKLLTSIAPSVVEPLRPEDPPPIEKLKGITIPELLLQEEQMLVDHLVSTVLVVI